MNKLGGVMDNRTSASGFSSILFGWSRDEPRQLYPRGLRIKLWDPTLHHLQYKRRTWGRNRFIAEEPESIVGHVTRSGINRSIRCNYGICV